VVEEDSFDVLIKCLACTCHSEAGWNFKSIRQGQLFVGHKAQCAACEKPLLFLDPEEYGVEGSLVWVDSRCQECSGTEFDLAVGIEYPDADDPDLSDESVSWIWVSGRCRACSHAQMLASIEWD
jgi:hypothetical protein